MKLVPAGVVLAAAVFLGLSQMRMGNLMVIYTLFGFGAATALMALAAYDYRAKRRIHGNR